MCTLANQNASLHQQQRHRAKFKLPQPQMAKLDLSIFLLQITVLKLTKLKLFKWHIVDRLKLCHHKLMDPDGGRISLQNKVQFDIRFHFCHRGHENMHLMQRSMFTIKTDYKTNTEYICKIEDEATKIHRETDQPIQTNYMMENKGDKYCPVCSFKMYMSHLEPSNPFLWQTPNNKPKNPNSPIWYTKGHLGKNTLGAFMRELSKNCELSQHYTNHCIRVTGSSILSRCKFNDKEVMSMTGHKSVQSLTVYQRVNQQKKMEMGQVLTTAMQKKDEELVKQVTHQVAAPMLTTTPQVTSPAKAIEAPPPPPKCIWP